MIFKVIVTGQYYKHGNEIEALKDLGFTFKELNNYMDYDYEIEYSDDPVLVELNSDKDFVNFAKKYGDYIISDDNLIEIYNDWREGK